jgi:tetratricopeptide (TPR) repeat protein
MRKYQCCFAACLLFCLQGLPVPGQSQKNNPAQSYAKEALALLQQKSLDPGKDYKLAEALTTKAIELLAAGNLQEADSIIQVSINTYPTRSVLDYAKELYDMSNIAGAQHLQEKLLTAVEAFKGNELYYLSPVPNIYQNGKMIQGIKNMPKERVLINLGSSMVNLNKTSGTIRWSVSLLNRLLSISLPPVTGVDYEAAVQRSFAIQKAIFENQFDKAIELTYKNRTPGIDSITQRRMADINVIGIYLEKGDYEKMLELTRRIEAENANTKADYSKVQRDNYYFMAYASMGKAEEAMKYWNEYNKSPYFIKTNYDFYFLAQVDIARKDYAAALRNIDSALHFTIKGTYAWIGEKVTVDKFKLYKITGDVYAGLQQYEKARDNYNIALLANPDYTPAIQAMASLESVIAKENSSDRTPPVITITEPGNASRGLTLVAVSSSEVMVRGTAIDPSGLKQVTINGVPVFSQPSGNFWGNINVKDGNNSITVKATDAVGNMAEATITITKKPVAAETEKMNTTVTDILPVTEKEGKNYCLLIAAQNYKDPTIPSLENPIQDAVRLKIILKKAYQFQDENIISLFNPDANDIKRQLLELTNQVQPEDNLLIFYAGHGIWVDKEKKGYWLMTDAQRKDPNTWVPNKVVLDLIAKLPARHTLLITDACFSGSVFKTRSITGAAPVAVQNMAEKISRVAITSGNDTEVPDESVFMKYLVKALSENQEKYMTAQKMFINHIIEAVMTETKTEPRYGTLELAGHVGGDFVFVKK